MIAGRDGTTALFGGSLHSSPAVIDKTVYVGSRDNTLYVLDTRTGEPRWLFKGGDHEDLVVGFNSSPCPCR